MKHRGDIRQLISKIKLIEFPDFLAEQIFIHLKIAVHLLAEIRKTLRVICLEKRRVLRQGNGGRVVVCQHYRRLFQGADTLAKIGIEQQHCDDATDQGAQSEKRDSQRLAVVLLAVAEIQNHSEGDTYCQRYQQHPNGDSYVQFKYFVRGCKSTKKM